MTSEIQSSVPVAQPVSVTPAASVSQGPAARSQPIRPIEKPEMVAIDDMGTVRAAAAEIDAYLKSSGRELAIDFDESLSRPIVRVVEPETSRVIREIPSEEVLQVARWIHDTIIEPSRDAAIKGLLVNGRA